MPELDAYVPQEWREAAASLRTIIEVLSEYMSVEPPWGVGSIAKAERDEQEKYASLPFQHPVATALVHPLMSLGQVRDHLAATAGVLETKGTVLAQLTLLRPILVGLGQAYFVSAPSLGVHERMRRVMNIELDSATEMMRFSGIGTEGFTYYDGRRRGIARAARSLWPSVNVPEPRSGKKRIQDWWIGDKPPTEMDIVRGILGLVHSPETADGIYRLLSAPTHAQPHALHNVLQAQQAVHDPEGFATAPLGISLRYVLTWLLAACMGLGSVIFRCCELYGWDPTLWNTCAYPHLSNWNRLLNG